MSTREEQVIWEDIQADDIGIALERVRDALTEKLAEIDPLRTLALSVLLLTYDDEALHVDTLDYGNETNIAYVLSAGLSDHIAQLPLKGAWIKKFRKLLSGFTDGVGDAVKDRVAPTR